MKLLELDKFICEYYYEDESESVYTIEGYSLNYIKRKISELLDADVPVTYKIYGVIEEGVEYP